MDSHSKTAIWFVTPETKTVQYDLNKNKSKGRLYKNLTDLSERLLLDHRMIHSYTEETRKEQQTRTTRIQKGKIQLSAVTSDPSMTLKIGQGNKTCVDR